MPKQTLKCRENFSLKMNDTVMCDSRSSVEESTCYKCAGPVPLDTPEINKKTGDLTDIELKKGKASRYNQDNKERLTEKKRQLRHSPGNCKKCGTYILNTAGTGLCRACGTYANQILGEGKEEIEGLFFEDGFWHLKYLGLDGKEITESTGYKYRTKAIELFNRKKELSKSFHDSTEEQKEKIIKSKTFENDFTVKNRQKKEKFVEPILEDGHKTRKYFNSEKGVWFIKHRGKDGEIKKHDTQTGDRSLANKIQNKIRDGFLSEEKNGFYCEACGKEKFSPTSGLCRDCYESKQKTGTGDIEILDKGEECSICGHAKEGVNILLKSNNIFRCDVCIIKDYKVLQDKGIAPVGAYKIYGKEEALKARIADLSEKLKKVLQEKKEVESEKETLAQVFKIMSENKVLLDFTGSEGVLKTIKEAAEQDFRDVDKEIIWFLREVGDYIKEIDKTYLDGRIDVWMLDKESTRSQIKKSVNEALKYFINEYNKTLRNNA